MEITTTTVEQQPKSGAATSALAIVGFIALIIIGILLAIYSVRLLPDLASRFGVASPFSSLLGDDKDGEPSLQVVTATSSLPIIEPAVVATSTPIAITPAPSRPATSGSTGTPAYTGVTTITTVGPVPIDPNGDPDLQVSITAVGYLRYDNKTDSFVADSSIDGDNDGAVKFTVKNIGTNVTGSWKFRAEVPSDPSQTYYSPTQRSLKPGDTVEYVLGFEKPREGDSREISITVDSSRDVDESNENNNYDSEDIDIDD